MDLNYELNELRDMAKRITHAPLNADREALIESGYELAERFLALDDVIVKSGMVPYEWREVA
jgi:hypothetical protein